MGNLLSRKIDFYDNLSNLELRVLLDHLLHHWTSEARHDFAMKHPMIYERMNPGTGVANLKKCLEIVIEQNAKP